MVKETKKTKSKTPAKQGKKQAKAKAVEKAEQQQSAPVEVVEVEQAKTKEQKLDEAKTKTPDSVPIKKQTRKVKASNKSKRFRKIEKITSDHRMNRGVVYLGILHSLNFPRPHSIRIFRRRNQRVLFTIRNCYQS